MGRCNRPLISMPDGTRVHKGLHYTNNSSKITARAWASCGKKGQKNEGVTICTDYNRAWINQCTSNTCKKRSHQGKGKLYCHGRGYKRPPMQNHYSKASECEITCISCDADYCVVTGWEKSGKYKFKLNSTEGGGDNPSDEGDNNGNTYEEAVEELKKEFYKKSKPVKEWTIDTPPLKKIHEGHYLEIRKPLLVYPQKTDEEFKQFFIGSLNYNNKDMAITFYDEVPEPGTEYQAPNSDEGGGSVDPSGTETKKDMMRTGARLGSVKKIYNYCCAKGGHGIKYKYIAGAYTTWNETAMRRAWYPPKTAKCVDFAWVFSTVCSGAGIKMDIWRCPWKNSGHWWNMDCNGKKYDLCTPGHTRLTNRSPRVRKVKFC